METIENIILVDDNRIDNLMAKKLIRQNGYTGKFVEFTDPTAALNYLIQIDMTTAQARHTLLIMDINMPVVNGFEVLHNFYNQNTEVCEQFKIIMLSSSCCSSDIETSYKHELISDYIIKPITPDKIKYRLMSHFSLVA